MEEKWINTSRYIRFDVLVKEDGVKGVGRVFDLEIFLCPRDIFNQNRPIYEFENPVIAVSQ